MAKKFSELKGVTLTQTIHGETKTVYIYSAVRTQASYGAGEEIDEYLTGDEPKLDQPGT